MTANTSVKTSEPAKAVGWWSPSDPGFHSVALPAKPWHRLGVKAVPHEPNRYWVESETLFGPKCGERFDARTVAAMRLKEGGLCPGCEEEPLERFWYTVDLSAFGLHGSCDCLHFSTTLAAALAKDHPSTWLMCQHRCKHIQAAAALHQLVYSELLERDRHKAAPQRRRTEGVGA